MKTSFLITYRVEIEHGEFTTIDPLSITEAANAGAQALANELVIINPVSSSGKNRSAKNISSAKKVSTTPIGVVTCSNGHTHDLGMRPWSNDYVRPEEAIGHDN